jgi:molybdopterin-guanine dinucleotide biosynthesis protein A
MIDAYILIGGRSSRFGSDKAFAELGGKTLAQRAFATTREALPTSRVTFVARNDAQFAIEAIRLNAPFIFDLIEGRGPLGGLHSALADARSPWILVMACDYPFVTPQLVKMLSEVISDEYGAVVPVQNDGRMQPLCAFYNVAKTKQLINEIIDRPRVPPPMHEIVDELSPRLVSYSEYSHLPAAEAMFLNVNFTSDLTDALKIERKLSAEK